MVQIQTMKGFDQIGEITGICAELRSYLVKSEGMEYRRNCKHLLPVSEPSPSLQSQHCSQVEPYLKRHYGGGKSFNQCAEVLERGVRVILDKAKCHISEKEKVDEEDSSEERQTVENITGKDVEREGGMGYKGNSSKVSANSASSKELATPNGRLLILDSISTWLISSLVVPTLKGECAVINTATCRIVKGEISHGAVHSMLSNKLEFPSFLRTISGTVHQDYALAQLIKYFGWKWVGILTSRNDLGQTSTQNLKIQIEKSGACVAFIEKMYPQYSKENFQKIVELVIQSSVNIIIVNSDEVYAKAALEALYANNAMRKTIILSAFCIINPGFFTKDTWTLINGTLGLISTAADIAGFKDFVYGMKPSASPKDIFVRIFWKEYFKCDMEMKNNSEAANQEMIYCSGKESMKDLDVNVFDLNDMSYTFPAYTAVYAFAYAIANLLICKPGYGPFINGSCPDTEKIQPWQVLHYVRNVHFYTEFGEEVYFDANGDVLKSYDIVNVQIPTADFFKLIKVGRIDPKATNMKEITVNTSYIIWHEENKIPHSVCSESCPVGYRRSIRRGQPACCFDCSPCSAGEISNQTDASNCLKCQEDQWPNDKQNECIPKVIEFLTYEEPLSILLVNTVGFLSFTTAVVMCIFVKYKDTPIVKANNRELSYLLLFSLKLCFLCSLLFIGHPVSVTCMLRQIVFGIVFCTSISCVLAKTITVVIAFKATNPKSTLRRWVGVKIPYSLIVCCCSMQIVICAVWLLVSPPFPQMDIKLPTSHVILECNEGKNAFFYCMLGYLGFLSTICFVVAFFARSLPDSYNEARYITFSMLVFVSVWFSFIPAYLSTKGKYMVAVEIFAILSSSAGLLGCIFVFKCYIILLRPDLNTRENLVGKEKFNRK
ncbi:extracellular calcium-sensing receptor-like [Protopterus annectens]|uniref:extracellular calcium-sensing receptor-like n=1 Tax=Protopterus annectens TaxID=7888 RepID=UPI001CFAB459|nr:extracellular calcium-sensing receptor-like [Protopterus annectens]